MFVLTTPQVKIGTWNVRTLYKEGKIRNVIKEMKRLELEILGRSEVRWTQSGKIRLRCGAKKTAPFYFLSNFIKSRSILITFGAHIPE